MCLAPAPQNRAGDAQHCWQMQQLPTLYQANPRHVNLGQALTESTLWQGFNPHLWDCQLCDTLVWQVSSPCLWKGNENLPCSDFKPTVVISSALVHLAQCWALVLPTYTVSVFTWFWKLIQINCPLAFLLLLKMSRFLQKQGYIAVRSPTILVIHH